MKEAFIGFYWTFPVNWADFRSLPKDVEAAAAVSRTIRYQMEFTRLYVRQQEGKLVDEIVFMDAQPGRATELILSPLKKARILCDEHRATLLYVDFSKLNFWRHNKHLRECLEAWGSDRAVPLWPEPIKIDGEMFDPRAHFHEWRDRDFEAKGELDRRARAGLAAALSETPEQRGRWGKMANLMNERGIRSFNGGKWTVENVRRQVERGKAKSAVQSKDSSDVR